MATADVLTNRTRWHVEAADCRAWLASLPADSVHCWVSSPPYFRLRSYLPDDHDQKADEIGSEATPEEYIDRMVRIFREARRVLHPSGSMFLNLGDSYAGTGKSGGGKQGERWDEAGAKTVGPRCGSWSPPPAGYKAKDLMMIPSRVAMALQADGWYLRSACPWVKRNPMPESVTDRPGNGCEWVFLLAKRPDYFFDMEAVKRVAATTDRTEVAGAWSAVAKDASDSKADPRSGLNRRRAVEDSRNLRTSDLWFDSVGMLLADTDEPDLLGFDVTPERYKGAHFAVMPTRLVSPMILAGTSARGVCPACGEPWTRTVERNRYATRPGHTNKYEDDGSHRRNDDGREKRMCTTTRTVGWEPGCECPPAAPVPAVVGDMFTGSGTVAQVAVDLGRRFVGCELNPDYHRLIRRRLAGVTPDLFAG